MALDDDIALFEPHPLVGRLGREALRLIAFSAERRSCRAGDVLARKGEPARSAFLVLSGVLALDPDDDGRPAKAVAGPGALVGELALFTATERPATIVAREPSTILVVPRAVMSRVLSEFPEAAMQAQAALAQELGALSGRLMPVRAALERLGDD